MFHFVFVLFIDFLLYSLYFYTFFIDIVFNTFVKYIKLKQSWRNECLGIHNKIKFPGNFRLAISDFIHLNFVFKERIRYEYILSSFQCLQKRNAAVYMPNCVLLTFCITFIISDLSLICEKIFVSFYLAKVQEKEQQHRTIIKSFRCYGYCDAGIGSNNRTIVTTS